MNHHEAVAEVRSGKLRSVYLIYGGEPFLEEELFKEIRASAVQPETADFNYHIFDPASDQLVQAISMAQTQPFFAERRLVVVRDCPAFSASRKKGEDEGEEEKSAGGDDALLAYLQRPAPSTCLVFLAREGVDSRKKVTKAVIAAGGAVECKPLNDRDALMWAQRRAQQVYHKRLGDPAARALLDKLGTDLRRIDSELQKLSLYADTAKEITAADVDTAVGGVADTEVFRLTEAVMLKQRTRALALLAQTLRQVDHPLQLLAALTSRFRQIVMVRALIDRGVSQREGPGLAKMHPFAYEKLAVHARSCNRQDVVTALSRLLEADLAMKSGFDPKLTLETVVVELMS